MSDRLESTFKSIYVLPTYLICCFFFVWFRRGAATNLPMAMRFRQLRLTSKLFVGVYRSTIHRRGLFCLRDIEAGEMVIEYAGEVGVNIFSRLKILYLVHIYR